jgi:MFS family permease
VPQPAFPLAKTTTTTLPAKFRLAPLASRQFRLLFLGRAVSFFGNAMAPIALAFAVLDLTGSKSDLGFVLAARTLPQVVFMLLGGIWADRLPRHRVMVTSSLLSGASQALVAALLIAHQARLWQLLVLAALNGTSSAFFFPAAAGVIPQTVDAALIQQANALLRLALNASWIGGAAIGGLVVAAFGSGWAVAVDAATFCLGAVFIGLMRLPPARLEGSSVVDDLREGWHEFSSRTWLWTVVAQFAVLNAAQTSAFFVLGPAVAKADLGGAAAWGAILTCMTAGLFVGGLVMLRAQPSRLLLIGSLGNLLCCAPLALLAVPAPTAAIAAAALLAGLGIETFSILWDTSLQENIPKETLSRVYSYDGLGSFVLIPVGQAVVGQVADGIGTSATLLGACGLVLASSLAVLCVPDVRNLRRRATA